jgi:outer membrane protein
MCQTGMAITIVRKNKHGRRFFTPAVIALVLFLVVPVWAGTERKTDGLLMQATGITREDVHGVSTKESLDLFDVYVMAVSGTERMAIEGEYALQADARRRQALGLFLPKISLKATKTLTEVDRTTPSTQRSMVSLYARQNLLTGLDEYASFRGSAAEQRFRRYLLNDSAGKLLQEMATVYLRALQIERTLKNREKTLDHYRGVAAELRRRVAVGRSRQSELLRTNSQIFKIQAEIESLQSAYVQARSLLTVISGVPRERRLVEEVCLPPAPEVPEDMTKLVESRYDVRAALEELEISRTRLLAAQGGHLPSVYLEGTYRLYQQYETGRDYWAGIGAELPIFTGGITTARVSEAASVKRQAELRLDQTRRVARQEIEETYSTYTSSMHEMESFKKSLDAAENNYRLILGEYRLNLVTLIDVFDALTALESARDDYERTVLEHCQSRVRLGVATGELLGPGIRVLRERAVERSAGQ